MIGSSPNLNYKIEHRRAIWRKAGRKYHEAHPERVKESDLKWRLNHFKKVREKNRKWREQHPDQVKLNKKRYYQEHQREEHEKYKKWRIANREKANARNRRLKLLHPERYAGYRAKRRERGFIPLIENIWDCPIDWHHVLPNQPYVISLPRSIHRAVSGKNHFVYNASIICQLYGFDLKEDNL